MDGEKIEHLYHLLVEEKKAHQVLQLLVYYRRKITYSINVRNHNTPLKASHKLWGYPIFQMQCIVKHLKALGAL